MSTASLPINRPQGQALVVGQPSSWPAPTQSLRRQGFAVAQSSDPYQAMARLCRQPAQFSTVVICLNSLFSEELAVIAAIKQRFSHVEIWLTQTEGRPKAFAQAMQLGADGVLDLSGQSAPNVKPAPAPQIAPIPQNSNGAESAAPSMSSKSVDPTPQRSTRRDEVAASPKQSVTPQLNSLALNSIAADSTLDRADPLLTAEELRALLQEPTLPPESIEPANP